MAPLLKRRKSDSLRLADLGYFSLAEFERLTQAGVFWITKFKAGFHLFVYRKYPFKEDGSPKKTFSESKRRQTNPSKQRLKLAGWMRKADSVCPTITEWRTRSGCYFCFFQRKSEWVGLLASNIPTFLNLPKGMTSTKILRATSRPF